MQQQGVDADEEARRWVRRHHLRRRVQQPARWGKDVQLCVLGLKGRLAGGHYPVMRRHHLRRRVTACVRMSLIRRVEEL